MPDGASERTVAICTSCGSAYAAEVWDDETIQPIGKRTGCDCGSTEFHVTAESADTALGDEEPG
nr:hypothetical protein [Natronorubrum texcoconense]